MPSTRSSATSTLLEDALRVYGEHVAWRPKNGARPKNSGCRELRDEELTPNGQARIPDSVLAADLFELLAAVETDMTIFFRCLAT